MVPCEELEDQNVECMDQQEKAEYWEANTPDFYMIVSHMQVDMNNSTEVLQPVKQLLKTELLKNRGQLYGVNIA